MGGILGLGEEKKGESKSHGFHLQFFYPSFHHFCPRNRVNEIVELLLGRDAAG